MWEIGERTILFTLIENVFSPVNQYEGSFSHSRGRTEGATRTGSSSCTKEDKSAEIFQYYLPSMF